MDRLFPENSYTGNCSCGTNFIAPKGTLHCHNCLYNKIAEIEKTCKSRSGTIIEYSNKIAELEKDISIAAKIMIDITNAQTVTDEGYSVGYLVTNKMMNGLDAFISKALKEQVK